MSKDPKWVKVLEDIVGTKDSAKLVDIVTAALSDLNDSMELVDEDDLPEEVVSVYQGLFRNGEGWVEISDVQYNNWINDPNIIQVRVLHIQETDSRTRRSLVLQEELMDGIVPYITRLKYMKGYSDQEVYDALKLIDWSKVVGLSN